MYMPISIVFGVICCHEIERSCEKCRKTRFMVQSYSKSSCLPPSKLPISGQQ